MNDVINGRSLQNNQRESSTNVKSWNGSSKFYDIFVFLSFASSFDKWSNSGKMFSRKLLKGHVTWHHLHSSGSQPFLNLYAQIEWISHIHQKWINFHMGNTAFWNIPIRAIQVNLNSRSFNLVRESTQHIGYQLLLNLQAQIE